MSQGSLILPTTGTLSGLTLVQLVNAAFANLASLASGATDPSTLPSGVQPFSLWLDTSVTPNALRMRNAANNGWAAMGTISGSNFVPDLSSGDITAALGYTPVSTSGSYANPSWLTSLAGSKITGDIAGNAGSVTNGVYTNGSYSDPSWITALAGSKITGTVGNASNATNATNATSATTATKLSTSSGAAPNYSARAWVNFDNRSTGSASTKGSGNISSYTNYSGYTGINMATAMPDANYAISGSCSYENTGTGNSRSNAVAYYRDLTSSSFIMFAHSITTADNAYGAAYMNCAVVFR